MSGADTKWVTLAKDFPAGLDTETDPTTLKDGWTPDGYGFDIEYPGRLVATASAIPAGDAFTAKTFTISDNVWTWFFGRLWRRNGERLEYNSPEYQASILYQDLDGVSFDEVDGSTLYDFFPVGSSMFIATSSGGFMIPNASSLGGDFKNDDVEEAMFADGLGTATPFDSVAYVSNNNGLYAWNGSKVEEVTELVRSSVSGYFDDATLRINRGKRRIVGSSSAETPVVQFVYDKIMDKLFIYKATNTDFLWTSKTMQDTKTRPFTIGKVQLTYDNTTGARGEFSYSIRHDKGWSDWQERRIEDGEGTYKKFMFMLEDHPLSTEFALRIKSLSPHIHIRRVDVQDTSNTFEETPSQ